MQYSTSFIDRNFWTSIIIVFFVLFAPLMFREWVSLRAEGLHYVEWHTTSMARLLQRDLEAGHSLPDVLSDLQNQQTFDQFDQHVRQKIGHLGLLNVKIFDASGEIIYALEKDLIGKIFLPGEGKKSALGGDVVSELIDRDEIFDKYGLESSSDLAEVYVPITAIDGEVPYILEAYYDYAPIMLRNRSLLVESALSLLATTLLALALLVYLYKGRQRMAIQVKSLEAILPICMHCKKIRHKSDDRPEEWMDIEAYFARQDDLVFSHGLCNDCLQEHYPETKTAKSTAAKACA